MWKYLQILERFINFTLHIWLLQALRRCHVLVFSYIFYFSPLRAPISRVINNVWLWWLAFSVFPFYLFIFIANRLYMSLTARILVRLDSLRGRFGRDGEQDETVRWRHSPNARRIKGKESFIDGNNGQGQQRNHSICDLFQTSKMNRSKTVGQQFNQKSTSKFLLSSYSPLLLCSLLLHLNLVHSYAIDVNILLPRLPSLYLKVVFDTNTLAKAFEFRIHRTCETLRMAVIKLREAISIYQLLCQFNRLFSEKWCIAYFCVQLNFIWIDRLSRRNNSWMSHARLTFIH